MTRCKKRIIGLLLSILTFTFLMMPTNAPCGENQGNHTSGNGKEEIVFVHTNDVHGNVSVEPYVKAVADTFRSSHGKANVLTVSAGDVFAGGQSIAHLTQGEAIVEIMNTAKYDAMAFGNNDLNLGGAQLLHLASETTFPILAANFYAWGTDTSTELASRYQEGDHPLRPYKIFITKGGTRIGILGLTTSINSDNPVYPYYYSEGTILTAESYVEILQKKEHCDIIVALAHTGWSDDLTSTTNNDTNSYQLATQVDGIDLVIDGHSHSVIEDGAGYLCDNTKQTLIVQTGALGNNVGIVEINTSHHAVTAKSAYQLTAEELEADFTPDSKTESVIAYWEDELDKTLGAVIASTSYFLNGERASASDDGLGIRMAEQNLGNLVTDALRASDSEVDVAMFPGVCLRSSIEAGDITLYDLYSVFANGGYVYKFTCTGTELIGYLETSIGSAAKGEESVNFQQMSGISFVYSSDGQIVSATIGESPLDEESSYTVLFGSIKEETIDGAALALSGYDDLVSVLQSYLESDAYDTENYDGPKGRITIEE